MIRYNKSDKSELLFYLHDISDYNILNFKIFTITLVIVLFTNEPNDLLCTLKYIFNKHK